MSNDIFIMELKFIKDIKTTNLISDEYLESIEKKYNVKFSKTLKEFYKIYNDSEINLCIFYVDDFEYEISQFVFFKK